MKIKGVTLVESMVTVSVISILVTIAAPNFVTTIESTKARKAADLIAQVVTYAKSESLNKNKNVYLTINNGSLCLSHTSKITNGHTCDVRSDALQSGTSINLSDSDNNQEIVFDGVYGLPDTNATITAVVDSKSKTVAITMLGFISIS